MTSRSEKNCNDFHKHVKYYKLWDLAASPEASKQMQPLGCASNWGRLKWGAPSQRAAWLHLHLARENVCRLGNKKYISARRQTSLCLALYCQGDVLEVFLSLSSGLSVPHSPSSLFSCLSHHLLGPWSRTEQTSSGGTIREELRLWSFDHMWIQQLTTCFKRQLT